MENLKTQVDHFLFIRYPDILCNFSVAKKERTGKKPFEVQVCVKCELIATSSIFKRYCCYKAKALEKGTLLVSKS